jgi:hypothetical protein
MTVEYRKQACICARVDYVDPTSVDARNAAVATMYRIVEQAERDGSEAVAKLVELLDNPLTAPWLAHQLVEKATMSPEVRKRCFAIVEKRAEGDGPEAMGERVWLKRWRDSAGED